MRPATFDVPAIALGLATYIAISGWFFIPPIGFLLAYLYEGAAGQLARSLVGIAVFGVCGYVTGRVARDSPVANAAALGAVIYAFVTALDYGLMATFGKMAPLDGLGQLGRLLRGIAAAAVGGLAAQWDMRRRSAGRFEVASLSRRALATIVALTIAPWLLLVLSFRT
jgi:alkylated DNA nucleotide flippase Atl1